MLTGLPRPCNGERTISSANGFGKTGYPQQKNEVVPLPYAINKNELKIDQRPKT